MIPQLGFELSSMRRSKDQTTPNTKNVFLRASSAFLSSLTATSKTVPTPCHTPTQGQAIRLCEDRRRERIRAQHFVLREQFSLECWASDLSHTQFSCFHDHDREWSWKDKNIGCFRISVFGFNLCICAQWKVYTKEAEHRNQEGNAIVRGDKDKAVLQTRAEIERMYY